MTKWATRRTWNDVSLCTRVYKKIYRVRVLARDTRQGEEKKTRLRKRVFRFQTRKMSRNQWTRGNAKRSHVENEKSKCIYEAYNGVATNVELKFISTDTHDWFFFQSVKRTFVGRRVVRILSDHIGGVTFLRWVMSDNFTQFLINGSLRYFFYFRPVQRWFRARFDCWINSKFTLRHYVKTHKTDGKRRSVDPTISLRTSKEKKKNIFNSFLRPPPRSYAQ